MLDYVMLPVSYFLLTTLLFAVVYRPIFMFRHRALLGRKLTADDLRQSTRAGFRTDLIPAAYLTALPLIMATAQAYSRGCWLPAAMHVYNVLVGVVLSLMLVADLVLYGFWKSKLDSSALAYLRSIRGVTASVSPLFVVVAVAAWIVAAIILTAYLQFCRVEVFAVGSLWQGILTAVLFLVLAAGVFICIRGLGRRPNNTSIAFFSQEQFLNHSALNPIYNFIYSLSVNDKIDGAFREFSDERCREIIAELYPTPAPDATTTPLLNTSRPNILLIIWESLSAGFVDWLGGKPGVTPQLARYAAQGVNFTRVDSGSFRTDRALPCILAGFPGMPTASVIRMGKKLAALPGLPRELRDQAGYATTAVHGGRLTIMHKGEFYLTMGCDRVISEYDFNKNLARCSWGVHDGEVAQWLFDDCQRQSAAGKPWFTVWQTLSSHEPFRVPYKRLEQTPVENSFAYVDDAVGRLLDRLKDSEMWRNLLVVIVADHSCNDAGEALPLTRDTYPHIPLVMTGGAVSEPRTVDTHVSQFDIPATLLAQLGLDHSAFHFSRNVMSEAYTDSWSMHTFNNGFVYRDATGSTVYDNQAQAATSGDDPRRTARGKAFLQHLYRYLADLH